MDSQSSHTKMLKWIRECLRIHFIVFSCSITKTGYLQEQKVSIYMFNTYPKFHTRLWVISVSV